MDEPMSPLLKRRSELKSKTVPTKTLSLSAASPSGLTNGPLLISAEKIHDLDEPMSPKKTVTRATSFRAVNLTSEQSLPNTIRTESSSPQHRRPSIQEMVEEPMTSRKKGGVTEIAGTWD
jgi:hypothetical protein